MADGNFTWPSDILIGNMSHHTKALIWGIIILPMSNLEEFLSISIDKCKGLGKG